MSWEKTLNLMEYFGFRSEHYGLSRPLAKYSADDRLAYYLDLTARSRYPGPADQKGVPMYQHRGNLTYIPVPLMMHGLGHLELYKKSNCAENLNAFRNTAEWLVKNQQEDGAWLMPVAQREYGLKYPWPSAMIQGIAMSCLLRAAKLFDNDRYLDTALKAIKPFHISTDKGGVTTYHKEGPFYEEFPCHPACHVLNGFFFAMWGIYDLMLHIETDEARQLWDDGVATISNWLPRYDMGIWSLYQIPAPPRNPATIKYHHLHVQQLAIMTQLTSDGVFQTYLERWQSYLTGRTNAIRTLPAKLAWLVKHHRN